MQKQSLKSVHQAGNTRGLWILLAVWFIVNLVQSIFTGLLDDEALYWLYGEHLSWGYYEHPPMVAVLIRAGYSLLNNETGIRLLFILSSTLTMYLIIRLSGTKNYLLFAALFFSALIVNIGGFLAVPDTPLFLFTALFFLAYRRFLDKNDVFSAILWGLIMAGLLYSKYNGILVILITLLSNLRLLKKKNFYISLLTAAILLLPHLIWSIANDFPTLRYHLFERNVHQHQYLTYFSEYIIGQIGINGPLITIFLFWMTVVFKPANHFDRSLKYTAIGILLFFLIYSFRGRIEANWTLPALVPMLIITVRSLEKRKKLQPLFYSLAAISIVVFIGFRIYLVHDYLKLPRKIINLSELHRTRAWADTISAKAGGNPVLFLNSYQYASKYIFYTGRPTYTIYDYYQHLTQFNLWSDMAEELQGKTVLVVDNSKWRYFPDRQVMKFASGDSLFYDIMTNFSSFSTVPVEITSDIMQFPAGTKVSIPVRIENPTDDLFRFDRNPGQTTNLVYSIYQRGNALVRDHLGLEITHMQIPNAGRDTLISILTPEKPGKYEFYLSLKTEWLPAGQNAKRYWIEVY